MEEEGVTTTTNTTIVTGVGDHQSTVGEVLATGFGAGEALFIIGLDHVRSTLQWMEQGEAGYQSEVVANTQTRISTLSSLMMILTWTEGVIRLEDLGHQVIGVGGQGV